MANTKKGVKKSTKKVVEKKITKQKPKRISIIQTDNEYTKPIIGLLIIVVILVVAYFIFIQDGGINKYKPTEDEVRFKEEYEKENEKNNIQVTIPEDNNIVYSDLNEVLKVLDNGTGVIFFGSEDDNDTRLIVEHLINASKDVEKIYYVDVTNEDNDIRDLFELVKDKPKKAKEGSEGYNDLLIALADYLEDYKLETSKGKLVGTGEKRLEMPTVVTVKKGVVKGAIAGKGSIEEYNELLAKFVK